MFEKVNPSHPDKVADRIAGALVDMAYEQEDDPRIAVEVLIGHGHCHIIAETSVKLDLDKVEHAVLRITGKDCKSLDIDYLEVPQDPHLAANQADGIQCGDNGIFKGCPITREQRFLTDVARWIYERYPSDGKYLIDDDLVTVCQSNADGGNLRKALGERFGGDEWMVNPIGDWTGGTDVDTGATNRKLGSDMGDAVTGGGIHGKDLSKADVTVNIWLHIRAKESRKVETACCDIGDNVIGCYKYSMMVAEVWEYIRSIGGFEKLAEWGLIR